MVIIKSEKTVSIITVTQLVRFECIKILYEMIKRQTYKNINEWVIVEGSQNRIDADKNKINIIKLKLECNLKINYIEYSGRKLGGLRNLGNKASIGDIIICLDDDDYYPPERIEEAVNKLNNSKCLIGGVSDVYLYDFFMDKLYKFKGFMEYHSTNNCMAYKKEFLLSNSHDPNIEVGEERSFTHEFTNPLVKFDSKKTIIAISHNFNTFNKRELCLGGTLKTLNTLTEINEPITNYIEQDIYNKMKDIYVKIENSPYDIVFYMGGFTRKWNPKNTNLGEGEIGVIHLSEYFKTLKKKVAIYGEFDENDTIQNGIKYINWKKFPYQHKFKTLILNCFNGFLSGVPFPINADIIIWDVYNNFVNNLQLFEFYSKFGHKINKIIFKSNFHKLEFEKYLGNLSPELYDIIPSGVRTSKFIQNINNVQRNPYRFCYINHYDRGLEYIIKGIFSTIKLLEPRAELHIYTGMDTINDNNFKNKMLELFSEHGIADHGDQSIEVIAREKHLSNFEIYISNIVNEVDCISIKESLVAGCIPLIANFGVFNEREGIKFDINHEDSRILKRIALTILNLLKDNNKLDNIRNEFKKSPTIMSWNQIGGLWLKYIK